MAERNNYTAQSEIFFSCTEEKFLVREHFSPEHVLTHVYAGRLVIAESDKTYTVETGDTVMFAKNSLAKITKVPGADQPFKSISVFFTQAFLQNYYSIHAVHEGLRQHYKMVKLQQHPLLQSLFNSILPYYELPGNLPEGLTDMKLNEAMQIIRMVDKNAEAILSDFGEPGKIDLANFMQRNFSYNISNEQFAYLTGRSLATFKRDFQKAFGVSPQKWLLQKRLEQAHYMITQRGQKPSDVYLEVGFENLSHFSYTFKQMFGYPPSSLSGNLSVLANKT